MTHRSRENEQLRARWRLTLAEALGAKGELVVLSGEDLILLSQEELGRLKEWIDGSEREASVVANVRPPVSFAASNFQMDVRAGLGEFVLSPPNYRDRFEKFDIVFGRGSVQHVLFSTPALIGGDVVTDFFSRIDMPDLAPDATPRLNVGLSAQAVSLMFTINRLEREFERPQTMRDRGFLEYCLRRVFPGTFAVSPESVQIDEEDVTWMAKRANLDLSESSVGEFAAVKDAGDLTAIAHQAAIELGRLDWENTQILQKSEVELCFPQLMRLLLLLQ